jgi:hypothetical protein
MHILDRPASAGRALLVSTSAEPQHHEVQDTQVDKNKVHHVTLSCLLAIPSVCSGSRRGSADKLELGFSGKRTVPLLKSMAAPKTRHCDQRRDGGACGQPSWADALRAKVLAQNRKSHGIWRVGSSLSGREE